jgi:flavin reductase (DIM6/NTAB) family NADH-FMN oxidoreductase RutF
VTIHSQHPFQDPTSDPARRLRGRIGGAVTLWTSGTSGSAERSGLTVSSVMVAHGEPPRVLALLDPDSELVDALESSGIAVVQLLQWHHRELAEMFAGIAPAPGGMFAQAEFLDTEWGPRLADAATWAGVLLEDSRDVGWSRLVTCKVARLEVGDGDDLPLVHRRGRYLRPS